MKKAATFFLVISAILTLSSCDPSRVFEENKEVAGEKWGYDDIKKFEVNVQDTAIKYNIGVNVRHSFQFEWRNMYVMVGTVFPNGKIIEKRVNLLLSEPDGKWYGRCLGENCFIYIPIQSGFVFPAKGKYVFTIKQDMRQNPLNYIKDIGLRLEKASAAKTEGN